LGAVIGVAVGDALGAALGGKGVFEVTAAEVDKAMEMCGGGVWGVAPGQVTGNTELMVCVAESLAESGETVSIEDLALKYGRWGKSLPFRGERACLAAFQRPLPAEIMKERAREQNKKSKGSGALVRCAPLAIWGAARGDVAAAVAAARDDSLLSHPDLAVGTASAAFVVAISTLLNSGGDRERCLLELQQWLKQELASATAELSGSRGDNPTGSTLLSRGVQERVGKRTEEIAWAPPGERLVALEEVLMSFKRATMKEDQLGFSSSEATAVLSGEVGSFDVPLAHALRHLKTGSSFEAAMRATLAGGGDSCTIAAVVGGLVGAAVGLGGIPERWVKAVLTCDTGDGQPRPPESQPCQLPSLVESLCARHKKS